MSERFTSLMRLSCSLVVSWIFLLAVQAPTHAQTVAVFDFELIDTSVEGEIRGARSDEQARLGQLSLQLRERLKDSGRFSLVDIAPVAAEARASNLQGCGGCDTRLAGRVGAELSITGTVQKVSNLILNMNIYVRDASSGATLAAMSADMRGNTDEVLVPHPRLADPQPAARARLRGSPLIHPPNAVRTRAGGATAHPS